MIKCDDEKIKLHIISNEIEYCKSYDILNKYEDEIKLNFVEDFDEIETFHLMTLCKGGITSNSSYSWWGSYLNNNDDKKFIMPKQWLFKKNINMGFKNILLL